MTCSGQLLETADVFVDGLMSGVVRPDGHRLRRATPAQAVIVYCHCSGFGATGAYAAIPTHGQMMNAAAAAVTVGIDDDGLVRQRPTTS